MARLTGKNGALYLCVPGAPTTFVWVADLYEWTVDTRAVTLPCRIKGDTFDRRTPSHGEGKLTAKRYVQSTAVLAVLCPDAIPTLDVTTHAFTNGYRVNWAVMGVDSGFPAGGSAANFNNALFSAQGTGYVEAGHQGAPRAQLEDGFEMTIDTLASVT